MGKVRVPKNDQGSRQVAIGNGVTLSTRFLELVANFDMFLRQFESCCVMNLIES